MLERLAIDGAVVDAFGEFAEVLSIDHFTGEVEDFDDSIAGFGNVEFKRSLVDCRVRIDTHLVDTSSMDSGDVVEDGGVENFIVVVDNIGGVHEDAAAVGAEIHGIGPLGLGEVVLLFRNTVVANVGDHGVVAGDLIHRGDGDTLEGAIGLPGGAVDVDGFVDAVFGADIDFASGAFNHGTVGGDRGGKRNVADGVVVARDVVDVNYIGGIEMVEAVEGDDSSVMVGTGIDEDGGDATVEESTGIASHEGVDGGDTGVDLIVELVADFVDGGVVVGVAQTMNTNDAGLTVRFVLDYDEGAVAILGHGGVANYHVGIDGAVDAVDVAPETGVLVAVEDSAEVGGEPAVGNVGVVGHVVFDGDSQHTAEVGLENGVTHFIAYGEVVVEDMVEGIGGMSGVENHNRVATMDLEGGTHTVVVIIGDVEDLTITFDIAKGVDNEGHAVVGESVIVGFPEIDLADSGTTLYKVGHEVLVRSPGLGVGVVVEVGISTADGTIARGNKDGATGIGSILGEAGSSHLTTVAFPDDVGKMVEIGTGGIVPSGVVGTAVMVNTGFDEGAGVAVGTADDGAIRTYGQTVDLDVVQATVDVGVERHGLRIDVGRGPAAGIIYTAVGDDVIVFPSIEGLFVPADGRNNLMDTGVDEKGAGVDGGHVVAEVKGILVAGRDGPLVRRVLDIAFTNPNVGTAEVNLLGVGGADGDGTAGSIGSDRVKGGDSGCGKELPAVGVTGKIETDQQTSLVGHHGVEVAFIGGS